MKEKEIVIEVLENSLRISKEIKKAYKELKEENPYYQLRLAWGLFINVIIEDTKRSPILRFFKKLFGKRE